METNKPNFAFTKQYYFKQLIGELPQKSEYETKIINQYELFNIEHKKTLKQYDIKNDIPIKYIRNQLITLNKQYSDFTKTAIKINIEKDKYELLSQALISKSYLTLWIYGKQQIIDFLFNQTCIKLGWFVVSDEII